MKKLIAPVVSIVSLWSSQALSQLQRYNAIRAKAGNDTWLLQVTMTFQFPD
jgi:hypothetical protein